MKKIVTYLASSALCFALLVQTSTAQTVTGSYSVQCTAYKQEQTQWCWAGVTRMVDWTYSSTTPPSQCVIVNKANDQCDGWLNTCCSTLNGSRPSACTYPSQSNFPNNFSGCNGSLSWLIGNYAGGNSTTSSSTAYGTVSNNLYNNKMMVARWGWSGGGGHFVAIYGCYQLNYVGQISYADPATGSKKTESHSYFTSNSSRTWTHSLTMNNAAYRPRFANPGLQEEAPADMKITLQPNPTQGQVQVLRLAEDISEPVEVTIANSLGSTVYRTTLASNQQETSLDLKNKLSSGIYVVTFQLNGVNQSQKLVIQ